MRRERGRINSATDLQGAANPLRNPFAYAVGYQSLEIQGGAKYSIFCPTFDAVTGKFTLGDIEVIGQDGKEYDHADKYHAIGSGKLAVYRLKDGALKMGSQLPYVSTKTGGVPKKWGDNKDVEFESGEGVVVYNGLSNLFFRVAGQVVLEPMYCIPGGQYSIFGNNTPNQMTLGDIGVYGQDGKEYDHADKYHAIGSGKLAVYKLKDNALKVGTQLPYVSTKSGGVPKKWGDNKTVTLDPGESVIVYNGLTNLYFRLKSPISK